jgi:GxxExxY protein
MVLNTDSESVKKQDPLRLQDRLRRQDKLLHADLTGKILQCCFTVARELGAGFLESVYQNALAVMFREHQLGFKMEQSYEVEFRGQKIGLYVADLVVENTVIVELKCCKSLIPEHQAQVINYLAASGLPVGLLVNFGHRNLEYKRLHHPHLDPGVSGAVSTPYCL